MTTHAYTEDQLVEQPAIGLFGALGWQTVSALEETFGSGSHSASTLGRETKGEVVLTGRLRAALERLNPGAAAEALARAVDELSRDRSAMSLAAANREVYALLKDGVAISVPDPMHGGQKTERVRVIDWTNPAGNDFLLVSQFSVTGALYTCRPDLVGFVNGLPWVVIELKKPGVPARAAFDENLTHYKEQIPALFVFNALMIASNGTDSRVGSLTADWARWVAWKRIEREDEPRRVSLEVMLRGTCQPTRLLDLVENFTLFSEQGGALVKVLAQNHQFLGVNNAIASMLQARAMGHGRGGVFWQTQGSGKSFSMVFVAQKVLRTLPGNWTFVVVTDRVELDEQIAKTCKATGAVGDAADSHAASGAHLRELLAGNQRYVFTLVHKFQTTEELCDRSDVIVLTDEAHRSQYDTLALNMRAALPHATFLAFIGTPLIAGEERTREVFGDYVSVYDFQQSIEDGATVPLFYENRTPELQLVNADLNDEIYELIENAGLDPDQEARLERELGRRVWWLCPASGCGRRVAVIHGGAVFACRHCHRLAYRCQRETDDDRATRRADTIRRRLGWTPGILNGSGLKPKGMHWRTFERLQGQHDAHVNAALVGMVAKDGLLHAGGSVSRLGKLYLLSSSRVRETLHKPGESAVARF